MQWQQLCFLKDLAQLSFWQVIVYIQKHQILNLNCFVRTRLVSCPSNWCNCDSCDCSNSGISSSATGKIYSKLQRTFKRYLLLHRVKEEYRNEKHVTLLKEKCMFIKFENLFFYRKLKYNL